MMEQSAIFKTWQRISNSVLVLMYEKSQKVPNQYYVWFSNCSDLHYPTFKTNTGVQKAIQARKCTDTTTKAQTMLNNWLNVKKVDTKHITLLVWYWATITQAVSTGKWQALAFWCPTCMQTNTSLKNNLVEDKRAVTYRHGGCDCQTSSRHSAWNGDKRIAFKSPQTPSNSQDKALPNIFYFWPQYLVRGQHALLGSQLSIQHAPPIVGFVEHINLLECVRECGQSVGISSTLEHPPMSCRTSFQAMPFIIDWRTSSFSFCAHWEAETGGSEWGQLDYTMSPYFKTNPHPNLNLLYIHKCTTHSPDRKHFFWKGVSLVAQIGFKCMYSWG